MTGRSGRAALVVSSTLLLGAVLRLIEIGGRRPLWLDESSLALNVGRRPLGGLVTGLDYDQVAPVLFLWAVKAVTLVAGMGEYALRLVPLLSGLLLPWVMWRTARAIAGTGVALIATGLTAVSVPLIYFSAELKPYGTDALASAVLMLLGLRVRAMPSNPGRWWYLTLAGVAAILLSAPAPFVLAGVGASLLADPIVRRTPGAVPLLVMLTAACAASFAVAYGAVYRPVSSTPFMQEFWAGTMLDPNAADLGERTWRAGLAIAYPFPPLPSFFRVRWFLVAVVAGMLLLFRKAGLPVALMVALPYLAVLAGSALGAYPVIERLLLFLAPLSLVALSMLIWSLGRLTGLGDEVSGQAGLLFVLAWSAPSVIRNGRAPAARQQGREVVNFVVRAAGSEPVYVTPGGITSWLYYSTDWRSPDADRLDRIARLAAETSRHNSLVVTDTGLPAAPGPASWGRAGIELIGRRTGLSQREPTGMVQATPDSGWARREVDRLVALGTPYAWVYSATWPEMELPDMLAEFARRGIRVVGRYDARHAVALRIRLPRATTASPGAGTPPL